MYQLHEFCSSAVRLIGSIHSACGESIKLGTYSVTLKTTKKEITLIAHNQAITVRFFLPRYLAANTKGKITFNSLQRDTSLISINQKFLSIKKMPQNINSLYLTVVITICGNWYYGSMCQEKYHNANYKKSLECSPKSNIMLTAIKSFLLISDSMFLKETEFY